MAVKILQADKWFSLCVRERADWICEKTGKKYPEKSSGLHCSHIIPRRNKSVRWCGLNAQALSYSAHLYWFHSNPLESSAWVREQLGEEMYDILIEKSNQIFKMAKGEEKEIAKHYKEEYEKIKKKRQDGIIGRIEFISYQ